MTRDELTEKVSRVVAEALGHEPGLVESKGPFVMKGDSLGIPTYSDLYRIHDKPPLSLQDALSCTSLEIVTVQMAIEEAFEIKFATGVAGRTVVDDEWDKLTDVKSLVAFVEKWITPNPGATAP